MNLFIKKDKIKVDAEACYDEKTGTFIVLKGSRVSVDVSTAGKFRGAKSVNKRREEYVKNCIVQSDVTFNSSSTAGNFVTGRSTDGPSTWKNEDGITLKKLLSKE